MHQFSRGLFWYICGGWSPSPADLLSPGHSLFLTSSLIVLLFFLWSSSGTLFLQSVSWFGFNSTAMAPSTRGWQMIEIVSVLVALCLVSVVARVVARYRRRVGFGIDDYLCLVSMVLMIAMLIELVLCKLFHF